MHLKLALVLWNVFTEIASVIKYFNTYNKTAIFRCLSLKLGAKVGFQTVDFDLKQRWSKNKTKNYKEKTKKKSMHFQASIIKD
jgi:hypothetical protein